uniref:Uncharacterized protein n=1 Tax=Romanomermis culicivorax TaxID=13658 RepID=A0A915JYH3_ROMCU
MNGYWIYGMSNMVDDTDFLKLDQFCFDDDLCLNLWYCRPRTPALLSLSPRKLKTSGPQDRTTTAEKGRFNNNNKSCNNDKLHGGNKKRSKTLAFGKKKFFLNIPTIWGKYRKSSSISRPRVQLPKRFQLIGPIGNFITKFSIFRKKQPDLFKHSDNHSDHISQKRPFLCLLMDELWSPIYQEHMKKLRLKYIKITKNIPCFIVEVDIQFRHLKVTFLEGHNGIEGVGQQMLPSDDKPENKIQPSYDDILPSTDFHQATDICRRQSATIGDCTFELGFRGTIYQFFRKC